MRGFFLGLAVMVLGSVARGEVVLNNLASGGVSPVALDFGSNEWQAVKFSANEGFNGFSTIQLNLFATGTKAGTYSVYLYADSGNKPSTSAIGSALSTGNISSLNGGTTSSVSISNVSISVQNAGTYWIAVQSIGNVVNELSWALGPLSGTNLNAYSSNGTSWTNTGSSNSLGGYISTTSVPEPGTLILGGIAAACGGGGVWWRRKRKPQVAETVETVTAV